MSKKKSKQKEEPSKVKTKISARKSSIEDNKKKQIKLLKSVIEGLINKQSVEIIDLLVGKKHVNEFIIAKNLNLTINQTRNILYKLSDFGLVSFIRKKDKRKGWYIYFWTLNSYQALSLLDENLRKKLTNLENQSKSRREGRHYVCNTCSIEVNEETALLNNFVCPECEEVYELSEDSKIVEDIEKKIAKLKKEIELVSEERGKEEEKLDKEKERKIKKAEAERKAKRAMTMRKTKKAKEAAKKQADKETNKSVKKKKTKAKKKKLVKKNKKTKKK